MFDIVTEHLLTQATTFKERNEISTLLESEKAVISNELVSKLYDMVATKAHIDFGSIPDTRGDIDKYEPLDNIQTILDSFSGPLKVGNNVQFTKEIDTVNNAINNLRLLKPEFVLGFKKSQDFVIIQYNLLVTAIVEATSLLLVNGVDYIREPQSGEYKITASNKRLVKKDITINTLQKFNSSVVDGSYKKAMVYIMGNEKEAFIGSGITITAMGVVSIILMILFFGRDFIYYYYRGRCRLEDYLRQQSDYLECNKLVIQNGTKMTIEERNVIIDKQDKLAKKLNKAADIISIDYNRKAMDADSDIKKSNSDINLNNLKNVGFKII